MTSEVKIAPTAPASARPRPTRGVSGSRALRYVREAPSTSWHFPFGHVVRILHSGIDPTPDHAAHHCAMRCEPAEMTHGHSGLSGLRQ
jgi:hypothetical protein